MPDKIKIIFLLGPAKGGIKTYLLSLLTGIDRHKFELYAALPPEINYQFSHLKIKLFPLNLNSKIGIIKTIITLIIFIRREKIKVVHSQGFRTSILAYFISKLVKVKTVSTVHTFLFSPLWEQKRIMTYKLFTRFFLNGLNKQIAICDAIFQELLDMGVKKDKIITIYNGIPLSKLENHSSFPEEKIKQNYAGSDFIVGCISRFAPQKGVEYFILSIPEILSKHSSIKFLLVGEGPTEEKIMYLISSKGLKENIKILPFQPKIDDILKAIDILVVPSLSEGLPYLILEAMAKGKVVVATSVGGIPEIIKHKENGYLVPSCDPQSISSAVIYLFENKTERECLSSCGKKTVEKYFTEDKMIKETEEVLMDLST